MGGSSTAAGFTATARIVGSGASPPYPRPEKARKSAVLQATIQSRVAVSDRCRTVADLQFFAAVRACETYGVGVNFA